MSKKKLRIINIVCIIIPGAVLTYLNRNFRFDDALIYFRYIENFINGNNKYVGEWFRKNTPQDTKIATVEIGHIGWYSKRYIIDLHGLTNSRNAEFLGKGEYEKWFDYYIPDYIIMHDPYRGQEKSISVLVKKGYFILDSSLTVKGLKIYKSTGKQ